MLSSQQARMAIRARRIMATPEVENHDIITQISIHPNTEISRG
jgi:hypothetical protein